MIKYNEPFMKKRFTASDRKSAYIAAVLWISTYIIDKDELQDVTFKMEHEDKQSPTVIVTLFVGLNENELRERHCMLCKEFHKSFFINENCNCSWCNTKSYQDRMADMIAKKKALTKTKLKKVLED